ncbi:hypothetical protein IFM89_038355 [Coptis chinensis]|uniref:Cysteinyl-tRNA synthetase n=1 Tax=Coptis chinensis TaxID=261450 RepID=A0A835I8L8_9MAGN|nr:hypothetical protein IFM89_038355 [Coptis chinensis]
MITFRQKQVFKPKNPGKVGMYVCGVTAYDLSHIGHACVYVSFDVLFRRYFDEFRCDMSYLHCISPSVEPRVSDHMPQIIDMIKQTLRDCEEVLSKHPEANCKDNIPPATQTCIDKFHNDFEISMLDDLHTPIVLVAMADPLKTINDFLHTHQGKKQELHIQSLSALEEEIKSVLSVLGLKPTSYAEVLQQLREKVLKRAGLQEDDVSQKIEQRTSARKNKEYERSDAIRKELAEVGIALMDGPKGTFWRPTQLCLLPYKSMRSTLRE